MSARRPGAQHPSRPHRRARPALGLALLPLRLFLGVTFVVAGAGKLLAPQWLGSGPGSFAAQATGLLRSSPLRGLLEPAVLSAPRPLAFLLAAAELAVGLLTLAGLATRLVAGGGLALSLLFFLTASWHVRPYFYGADLPFAVGWVTLLAAGHAGQPSIDGVLERRTLAAAGLAPAGGRAVAVPLERLRELCSGASGRACRSAGPSCAAWHCPLAERAPGRAARHASRRAFLTGAGLAGLGALGASLLGGVLVVGARTGRRLAAPAGDAATRAAAPVPARPQVSVAPAATSGGTGGARIASLAGLPVGRAVAFRDPNGGGPAVAVRVAGRRVLAYSAVCTHAGCTVAYDPSQRLLACPCHGARFDPAANGTPVAGPATEPLAKVAVTVGPDGGLYA
jgi:thiosulfate dehydrogenase [quinone] large subunit